MALPGAALQMMAVDRLLSGLLCSSSARWLTLVLAMLAASFPPGALAEAGSASIVVVITDAQSGAPVPLAQVRLQGPTPLIGYSGRDGRVRFGPLEPGDYAGTVVRVGYRPTTIARFSVQPSSEVSLTVTLSRLIRIIGTVTVKARTPYDTDSVKRESAESVAAGSFTQALSWNPSLNLNAGQGAFQSASVEGRSPAQSPLFSEGAPLVPVGTAANLQAINTDVFDSAQVSSGPQGGALDFRLPDPTIAFSALGSASYASFDNSALFVGARGTAGYTGYSVGLADRINSDPVNGQRYLDQSGYDYFHNAESQTASAAAKFRAALAPGNVLSGTLVASHFDAPAYCSVYAGALPCGFGPGNYQRQTLSSWQVKDAIATQHAAFDVSLFSSSLHGLDDMESRVVNLVSMPLAAGYNATTSGASAHWSFRPGGAHVISMSATDFGTTTGGSATVGQTLPSIPAFHASYHDVALADAYDVSPTLNGTFTVGNNGVTGAPSLLHSSFVLTSTPNAHERITASYGAGALSPPIQIEGGFSDPTFLQFNCDTHTAFGLAPSQGFQPGETIDARLSATEELPAAQFAVSIYRQVLHGAILDGLIDGAYVDQAPFPPGYLASVSSFYASPAGCAKPYTLSPSDLALTLQTYGTAVYEGGTIAARVALDRDTTLQTYYATTAAAGLVNIPGSTLSYGTQVLGVPLHKYGAAVDWRSPEIEGILRLSHVAANNANFLPAYTTVDLAGVLHGQNGSVIASVTNLFNQFGYRLGSPAFAEPISVQGAQSVTPIAIPLLPRSFQIAYRAQLGATYQAPGTASNEESGLPTSTTFAALPLAATPGDPFALATNNPQCGPESAALAKPVLEALRTYVSSGAFFPIKDLPNGQRAALRLGPQGRPAFLIAGTRAEVTAALFSCALVHAGMVTDAQRAGVYAFTTEDQKHYDLAFSLPIGFYVTLDARNIVSGPVIPYRPLPSGEPKDPFATDTSSKSCTTEIRSAAEYVLGGLRSYFASLKSRSKVQPPDGVSVIATNSSTVAYRLEFDDPTLQQMIEACGLVYSATPQQLLQRGLAPVGRGALIFAPSVGLYIESSL
jgi:hypothetical protein